jgi:tripartite-type tricarboxylate transporter receptor subunit TctC
MSAKRRPPLLLSLALTVVASLASPTQAQNYPNRPVNLIVPFTPAGPMDIMGRLVAEKLSEKWGVPVVVGNYPGAGGNIGSRRCADAVPDGYTICIQSIAQTIAPSMYSDPGFDPVKDFAHVAPVAMLPSLLVVNPALPVKNVQDLIALAKAKPGVLNYATGGKGTSTHLLMEEFAHEAGVSLVQIPYKGSAPALMDQMSGRIAVAFYTVVAALPYIKDGRLRAIAISTKHRLDLLPDVPTIDESGLKGFDGGSWAGMVMPAGTPREIVSKINTDLEGILKSPAMKQRLRDMGGIAFYNSPDGYTSFVKSEVAKWAKVVKDAGIAGN